MLANLCFSQICCILRSFKVLAVVNSNIFKTNHTNWHIVMKITEPNKMSNEKQVMS